MSDNQHDPNLRSQSGRRLADRNLFNARSGRILVAIPTTGRSAILRPVVHHLAKQTRLPDAVILSGAIQEDFGSLNDDHVPFALKYVLGPRGLCRQRNRVLDLAGPEDIILFLDDDFLLAPDYLAQFEEIYASHPDIVMTTGDVLADGILGPGFNFEQGCAALEAKQKSPRKPRIVDTRNAYGCNMGVRMETVRRHDLRFDEKLPLYAWFEDVDFSLRAARHGRVVKCDALRGVHLGTKTGRTPGKKLGYSQICNLAYLSRQGVLPYHVSLKYSARHLVSNLVRSVFPVPWADHRGRFRGNLMALSDILLRRADPGRVTDL